MQSLSPGFQDWQSQAWFKEPCLTGPFIHFGFRGLEGAFLPPPQSQIHEGEPLTSQPSPPRLKPEERLSGLPPTSTGEGGDPIPGVGGGGLRAGTPLPSQLHMQREGLHATETDAETHLEAGVRGPSSTPPPAHCRPPQIPRPGGQGHGLQGIEAGSLLT